MCDSGGTPSALLEQMSESTVISVFKKSSSFMIRLKCSHAVLVKQINITLALYFEGTGCWRAKFPLTLLLLFQVRDGSMSSSPLLGTFCGDDLPPRLQSTQRSLYVRFSTDASVSNHGFQAAFGSALEGEKRN